MSHQICENQCVTQTINPDNTWQHSRTVAIFVLLWQTTSTVFAVCEMSSKFKGGT